MIAMAHPDLFAPVEKPAGQKVDALGPVLHVGAAEFGGAFSTQDLAAQHLHHHLLAVADAQDRHAKLEDACGRTGGALVDHAGRTAREDHRLGGEVVEEGVGDVLERVDFAIDVELAQAAGDQLRDLAAEIDDQQAFVMAGGIGHMRHGRGIGRVPDGRKMRVVPPGPSLGSRTPTHKLATRCVWLPF